MQISAQVAVVATISFLLINLILFISNPSSAEYLSSLLFDPHSSALRRTNTEAQKYNDSSLNDCIKRKSPTVKILSPNDGLVYIDASAGYNLRFANLKPQVVIVVRDVEDVKAGVICAREFNTTLNVMNGGHSFEGMSSTTGILIKLDEFINVTRIFQEKDNSVFMTVQSGMRFARMYGSVLDSMSNGLLPKTSAFYGGTCPTVGVTGHSLCGGYGMMGRTYGRTSDLVHSVDVVLPSGQLVTANQNSHSDLFWALRGACSASFGVVVSITFKIQQRPTPRFTIIDLPIVKYNVTDGHAKAIQSLLWWQTWATVSAPSEMTAVLNLRKDGVYIQALYGGPMTDALNPAVWRPILEGLDGIFTEAVLRANTVETDYAGVIRWMTGVDDIPREETIDYLLHELNHLPPVANRGSRRYTKSQFVMCPLSSEQLGIMIDQRRNNSYTSCEFKAYGGSGSPLGKNGKLFNDNRSPLYRGQSYEMHWGGSANEAEVPGMLQQIQTVSEQWNKWPCVSGENGYIGYIDTHLKSAGVAYFGQKNVDRLRELRLKYDPHNIASTRASEYLYPSSNAAKAIVSKGSATAQAGIVQSHS